MPSLLLGLAGVVAPSLLVAFDISVGLTLIASRGVVEVAHSSFDLVGFGESHYTFIVGWVQQRQRSHHHHCTFIEGGFALNDLDKSNELKGRKGGGGDGIGW